MFASKIRFCFFVSAVLFATLAVSFARQASSKPEQAYSSSVETETRHSSVDFVPDGDLTKPAWKHAKWSEFDNDVSGKSHYPDAATRVAPLWTETHIYLAFSARYDSLNVYEGEDPETDRKSTRLNSSHSQISYAV